MMRPATTREDSEKHDCSRVLREDYPMPAKAKRWHVARAIPCKEAGESSRFPLGSENMLVIGGVVTGGRCATVDLFSCMRPRLEWALSYRAGAVLCRMN